MRQDLPGAAALRVPLGKRHLAVKAWIIRGLIPMLHLQTVFKQTDDINKATPQRVLFKVNVYLLAIGPHDIARIDATIIQARRARISG